jgi:TetR/AcrR family transcriptional repressor of mexJK operon
MKCDTLKNCFGRPKDTVKHGEILLAATKLFMEKGYELTSMEAVARQANVSKLTIYSHFSDKKELFRAIIQARCDQIGMPSAFTEETQLPAVEALRTISRFILSNIYQPDSIRLIRLMHAEAMHRPEIAQIYSDVGPMRIQAAFADLLRAFTLQGKLEVHDPISASSQFFSLLKGEMLQRVLLLHLPLPSREEIEAHIEATIHCFLATYRPGNIPLSTTKTETL